MERIVTAHVAFSREKLSQSHLPNPRNILILKYTFKELGINDPALNQNAPGHTFRSIICSNHKWLGR